jgi:hypothetical protein
MPPECDSLDRIAELRHQHAAIAGRINAALIAGIDTGPIRAEAADLTRRVVALEAGMRDADAKREAASRDAISAAAAVIAADAEKAILAKMAALQPPAHP